MKGGVFVSNIRRCTQRKVDEKAQLELSTRIVNLRTANGMTQFDLATSIGVQQPAILKWEKGYNCPSIPMLIKLADVFGCTLDYLLGRDTSSDA